jgi:TonB family protein
MPWELSAEADARFQRIVRLCVGVFLLFGIVMPYLPLPEFITKTVEEPAPRLATLIFEIKQTPPAPVQVPEPKTPKPEKQVKAPKPATKKPAPPKVAKTTPKKVKPAPIKPKISARKRAEQSGLLAMKDALADMRQNTVTSTLQKTSNLSQAGGKARSTDRAVLTSGTTRSSGGIQTASLSRNTGGGQLAGRATTQVHSPSGNAPGGGTAGSSRGERSAGRSIEEIQMVFDRNKGAIFSVYNRALRKDPNLQGKVVLELTIAPSGKVTRCVLVSSELQDAVLGKKISQRVKLFNFEAKDVSEVTITYPIEFLPA